MSKQALGLIVFLCFGFFLIESSFAADTVSLSSGVNSVVSDEQLTNENRKVLREFEQVDVTDSQKLSSIQAQLAKMDINTSYLYKDYWTAVFHTLGCQIEDKGRIIPRCIISHLSEIKKKLHKAEEEYPHHFNFAPARTLAVMYFEMPMFVGGSKKKALAFLAKALEGDPEFPENIKAKVKIKGE